MVRRVLFYFFVHCMFALTAHAQALVDGVYHIQSVEDLLNFSDKVNNGENTAKAVLESDLNLTGVSYTPIGTNDSPYYGHFDGQGHMITNLSIVNSSQPQLGFFGTIAGGCVIENLIIGSGRVQGQKACGGLVGACRGNAGGLVKINNCGNAANVTCSAENAAGILGCNYDGHTTIRIKNCYNTGVIRGGKESAAISGWIGSAPGSLLTNCYNNAKIYGLDGSKNLYRTGNEVDIWTNCYDITTGLSKSQGDKSLKYADGTNGKLCYLLGFPYTQDIGKDRNPTFGKKVVVHVADNMYINEGDTVPVLAIKDGKTELTLNGECTLDTVTYTREFTVADTWEPLYVPFDSKTEDWEGVTIAQVYDIRQYDDDKNGTVDRGEIEFVVLPEGSAVKQNTPYIIKAASTGVYTITPKTPTLVNPERKPLWCANTETLFCLNGNLSTLKIAANGFGILQDGNIAPSKKEVTLVPMRWYMSAEEKGTAAGQTLLPFTLKVYEQDVTAIEGVAESKKATMLFDLSGKPALQGRKGLFIKDGKKYFKK